MGATPSSRVSRRNPELTKGILSLEFTMFFRASVRGFRAALSMDLKENIRLEEKSNNDCEEEVNQIIEH